MQIVLAELHRGGDAGDGAAFALRGLRFVDRTEQQHRKDRPDRAEADKAKAVRLGVFPCLSPRIEATPTPSAMMNGTVIGPVVTPPESNATERMLSFDKNAAAKTMA